MNEVRARVISQEKGSYKISAGAEIKPAGKITRKTIDAQKRSANAPVTMTGAFAFLYARINNFPRELQNMPADARRPDRSPALFRQ